MPITSITAPHVCATLPIICVAPVKLYLASYLYNPHSPASDKVSSLVLHRSLTKPLWQHFECNLLICQLGELSYMHARGHRPSTLAPLMISACQPLSYTGGVSKPVPAHQFQLAAAQLYGGSSPAQLAALEMALQEHFGAPFATLGHGTSLLQCLTTDEVMLQTVTAVAPTVPLHKVGLLVWSEHDMWTRTFGHMPGHLSSHTSLIDHIPHVVFG